jgi:hypothetical protein
MPYNYYFLKLYFEILDDPKMCLLSDRLYRRTIECFLAAGKYGKNGILPPVEELAWRLRLDQESLEGDLTELSKVGIVHQEDNVWIVSNYAKRQERISGADRVKAFRERKKKQKYYGNETDTVTQPVTTRYTDKNRIEEESKTDVTMRDTLSELTGLLPTPNDIDTIRVCVEKDVMEEDIRAALAFFRDKNKVVRSIAQLENSIIYHRDKRIQGNNAKADIKAPKGYTHA